MNTMNKDILVLLFGLSSTLLFSACSHVSQQRVTLPNSNKTTVAKPLISEQPSKHLLGQQIAALAKSQLGKPYRYGGDSPTGFDCSGLVYFSHTKLSIRIPRTSHQQHYFALPIKTEELESGDAVFFTLNGKNISHVGIYIGKGQFVHAPKSGKMVSTGFLSDLFWKTRFVGGGRLYLMPTQTD